VARQNDAWKTARQKMVLQCQTSRTEEARLAETVGACSPGSAGRNGVLELVQEVMGKAVGSNRLGKWTVDSGQ